MQFKWIMGCALLALAGCQSTPVENKADNTASVSTTNPEQLENIVELVKTEPDEQVLLEALRSLPQLNQTDPNTAIPLLHYLVAIRSPEAVQLALDKGADVGDAIAFAIKVNHLNFQPAFKRQNNYLSFQGDLAKSKYPLSDIEAQQLIEKFVMVRIHEYQKNAIANSTWKVALNEWKATIQKRQAELNKPIFDVPEPTLPPVSRMKKSPFESLAMFQQRMDDEKKLRQTQTAKILAEYRAKVEARNKAVLERKKEIDALQQEIKAQNLVFENKQRDFFSSLPKELAVQKQAFIAEAMAVVYGSPKLVPIQIDGQPKYDAERGLMFAMLSYANLKGEQEVTFAIPPGQNAESFYNALIAGEILPKAVFKFANNNSGKVEFVRLEVKQNNQTYLASFDHTKNFVAQKPIEVVLQDSALVPQLAQDKMTAVVFNQDALSNLQLQNPNLKDVQFEAYVLQEQKAFKDDIPNLFEKVAAAPIDRKKWLFVVGIGQYEQTDDILYSRRSAEWFARVAAKTLGIQPGRQVLLLDKQASSGAIKDQLKLMLSKVKQGDEIIFYYSGHGIPVSENGNAPYLLAADKIPDFVADDDFFQAQNIYNQLINSQASSVLAFMDSCFTGQTDGKSVFAGTKAATRLVPKQFKPDRNGKIAILTAGNEKQFSNAYGDKGHRLFSYYLMKGLLKGYTQVGDLATKVKGDVTDTSLDMGGLNRQTPVFVGNGKLKI